MTSDAPLMTVTEDETISDTGAITTDKVNKLMTTLMISFVSV